MKGIIFNLVEETVVADHGEDAWESLLESAGVEGAYTALGQYPDEELSLLITAGAAALGVSAGDLTRRLGRSALLGLARRYPRFFEGHQTTRPFLMTLNDVIHPEVRKLHVDADPPDFVFRDEDPSTLVMEYRSHRQLCALAEGMIVGAGVHFGEVVTVEHDGCMLDGAAHCTLLVARAASGG